MSEMRESRKLARDESSTHKQPSGRGSAQVKHKSLIASDRSGQENNYLQVSLDRRKWGEAGLTGREFCCTEGKKRSEEQDQITAERVAENHIYECPESRSTSRQFDKYWGRNRC